MKNETPVSFFRNEPRTPGPDRRAYFESAVERKVAAKGKPILKINDHSSFFADAADLREEARDLAFEAIRRLLIWMSDGPTLEDRGLRATVARYCVCPELIDGATGEGGQ